MILPRRTYLINRRLQYRFILSFVLMVICWGLATVGAYMYLVDRKLDAIRYSSHVDIRTTGELLLPITLWTHAVSLLIFAVILAVAIRLVWMRLSPPLFSIKKDLARIASGDLAGDVSLCRGEEFQDLACALEGMRAALRQQMSQLKERQRAVAEATTAVERAVETDTLGPAHLERLLTATKEMRAEMGKLRL